MNVIRPISEVKEYWSPFEPEGSQNIGEQRKWYCGIEGITSIWNGSWNEPEIGYKGYAFNEFWFTDGLYNWYEEENEEKGIDMENMSEDDRLKGFAIWLKENAYLLCESLDEAIEYYEKERKGD